METMSRIEDWEWSECEYSHYRFWTTKDPSGNTWIVKFTGSFYSYRELVFNKLASRLGLNVRKVQLAWISKSDLRQTGHEGSEPFQLLLEPIEMHGNEPCNSNCSFPDLKRRFNEENDYCEFAASIAFPNAVDCILKDFLSDIFGANETSECMFAADHTFYVIDNEQMFSMKSSGKISAPWLFAKNGAYSESGHKLLKDLCHKIASLTDTDLRNVSKLPHDFKVDMIWPILPILRQGKRIAHSILKNGPVYYQ